MAIAEEGLVFGAEQQMGHCTPGSRSRLQAGRDFENHRNGRVNPVPIDVCTGRKQQNQSCNRQTESSECASIVNSQNP